MISNIEVNEAVIKMGRLLSSKSAIPVLAGVLVESKEDCLMFTASDGTESIIHRIMMDKVEGNEVLQQGRSVFSKETFDVAKKLKGNITFELNDTVLTVSQNKTKLEFPTMDAEDYPKIAVESNSSPLILSGPSFADMVSRTTFAASKNDMRPILMAVNMSFKTDETVFVSTDSHRLSRIVLDGCHHEEEDFALSVPASILDQAMKSFDLSLDVMIFPNNQSIALASGNGKTILISRLLEGVFPEVSRLIPTDFETNLVVNRKEFVDGLELLQAISSNSVINLKVDGLFVELKATGTGTKGTKELAFETYDGEENFSIGFSAQYVLDALKRMDESSVRLRFNGSMKPFVIVSASDESNAVQLVLPVRQS
ncbi:DNA polymerase III subunit beta [Sporosarcina sp. FSL K6-1508]|uniref:DNA polymerase III subunit beta n=1 Tax=Sporosarcina sp. FSL K6-1508 TaxID=2921553 RepID=UPI0030F77F18